MTPSLAASLLLPVVLVLLLLEKTREAVELRLEVLAVETEAKDDQETEAVAGVDVDFHER